MINNLLDAISHVREVAREKRIEVEDIREVGEGVSPTNQPYNIPVKACLECAAEHDQLADLLTELQERREADRWIPVSERLPEDRNLVLVTAYWHETYQVMQASYFGEGEKNGWWCVPWNNCGKHMRNDLHVIAWRPLPKPYESEGYK